MPSRLFLLFLLTSSLFSLQAQTQDAAQDTMSRGGIVYGKNHAFMIEAPKGWVLDNKAGVSQGLHAVFYPAGGSWKESPAVMYANTADKEVKGNETLAEVMAFDEERSRDQDPSVEMEDVPNIVLKGDKEANVRTFIGANYEAVAYIDEPKIVVMLVLTARTHQEFRKSYPAFEELVKSYTFLTEDVTFPKR